jgi:hypothetical protein
MGFWCLYECLLHRGGLSEYMFRTGIPQLYFEDGETTSGKEIVMKRLLGYNIKKLDSVFRGSKCVVMVSRPS